MIDEHERHFKKARKKPWLLELTIKWPEKSWMKGGVSVWTIKYATEKAALQAQPDNHTQWEKLGVEVTSRVYERV